MKLEQIKLLDSKDKKNVAFKMIFEIDDSQEREHLIEEIISEPKNLDLFFTLISAYAARETAEEKIYIRSMNPEIMYYYKNILDNMKKLADELNISNSLQLSNLFTYLLWNGYLSKNKINIYEIRGLKSILGLQFADIMDGKSVCRNHADMLNDFLCSNGYNCSQLSNRACDEKVNKFLNRLKKEETYLNKKIINLIKSLEIKKIGNHVFNLIEEENELYIYDSTNRRVLNIDSIYYATTTDGKNTYSLRPYLSYRHCINDNAKKSLDKLHTKKQFSSPYSDDEITNTTYINDMILSNNITLLKDFYTEVRPSIVNISEKTDKIKTKQKYK